MQICDEKVPPYNPKTVNNKNKILHFLTFKSQFSWIRSSKLLKNSLIRCPVGFLEDKCKFSALATFELLNFVIDRTVWTENTLLGSGLLFFQKYSGKNTVIPLQTYVWSVFSTIHVIYIIQRRFLE